MLSLETVDKTLPCVLLEWLHYSPCSISLSPAAQRVAYDGFAALILCTSHRKKSIPAFSVAIFHQCRCPPACSPRPSASFFLSEPVHFTAASLQVCFFLNHPHLLFFFVVGSSKRTTSESFVLAPSGASYVS